MLPVRVHTYISAPREEIFDFVADLANRASWTDHWTSELRLAHPKSDGVGAAAHYRLDAPGNRQWVNTQIVEAERPRRIVETTRGGRLSKTRGEVAFELSRAGRDLTRVELTIWTEAGTPRERFKEKLGTRGWTKRQAKVALERLRTIFEEQPDAPLARVTVAGWEPQKAPRWGVPPGPRPRPHTGSGRHASSG